MSSQKNRISCAFLTAQACSTSIAFFLECGVLFTLIAIDSESRIWGSFYLFLVLCAPYCLTSLLSVQLLARFNATKLISYSHGFNALASALIVMNFENNSILWSALAIKSGLRGIATVAEIHYVKVEFSNADLLGINARLQSVRQFGRFLVPLLLILLSSSMLGLVGLIIAGIAYLFGAIIALFLSQSTDRLSIAPTAKFQSGDAPKNEIENRFHTLSLTAIFCMVVFDASINTIFPQLAIANGFSRSVMAEAMILTGIGGIVGAALAKRLGALPSGRVLISTILLTGILIPLCATFAKHEFLSAGLIRFGLMMSGASLSVILVIATTNLQRFNTNENTAREGGIRNLLIGLGAIIGSLCSAALSTKYDYVDATFMMACSSSLCILLSAGKSFTRNSLEKI